MTDLWPLFLIAPGAGFLLMYRFGSKETGLLIPGLVLLVLGVFFLIGGGLEEYFWPVILIGVGILILLRRKTPGEPPPGSTTTPPPHAA